MTIPFIKKGVRQMKNLPILCLIFSLIFFSPPVQGAESVRIGVVDFQRALDQCEAGKDARLELEKLFRDKEKVLADQRDEIKRMQEALDKQATMLSPEALAEKRRDFTIKNRDFQRNYNDFVEEMKMRENELRIPILKEMDRIVSDIGKKGGYTLIVHKDKTVIIYSPASIEITDELIQLYNEFYKKTRR
jgi:outer membrane protein